MTTCPHYSELDFSFRARSSQLFSESRGTTERLKKEKTRARTRQRPVKVTSELRALNDCLRPSHANVNRTGSRCRLAPQTCQLCVHLNYDLVLHLFASPIFFFPLPRGRAGLRQQVRCRAVCLWQQLPVLREAKRAPAQHARRPARVDLRTPPPRAPIMHPGCRGNRTEG